ncbi:MAG: phospholipid-binding domain-containing protein [Rhodospirillaceae bacterium]|nr:phospholipid-binding domain-containing protein [Rhodospirillaceae bacterium]
MKPWATRKLGLGLVLTVLAAGAATGLGGCASVVIGAGATTGIAVAQERAIGQAVNDATITVEINHQLFQKSEILFRDVDVEVVEGRVLLTGNVKNPEDRVEVARLTWQAKGVREVLNELKINDQSSLRDYAKDVWITTQLKVKLLGDTDISAINYSVDTLNGVVYLFGIAQSQVELDRATGHARNIKGVTKVVSHVILKTDPKRNS